MILRCQIQSCVTKRTIWRVLISHQFLKRSELSSLRLISFYQQNITFLIKQWALLCDKTRASLYDVILHFTIKISRINVPITFVIERKWNIPVEMRIFLYKEKYRTVKHCGTNSNLSSIIVSILLNICKTSFYTQLTNLCF